MEQLARKNLDEVSFIRPILILLLVVFHSFAIFSGAWDMPEGLEVIPAYGWVARSAYAIMLECFVFLSGYLWAYQRETMGKKDNVNKLIVSKFNRLIIPCLVFGVLYIVMIDGFNSLKESALSVWGGVGHLWFLPMLFWCFLLGYPIVSRQRNPIIVMSLLTVLTFCSIIPLPLRISMSFYYLFFFIGGYYCWQYKEKITRVLYSKTLLIWVLFIITFIGLSILVDVFDSMSFFKTKTLFSRLVSREIHSITSLIYASLGTIALWLTSLRITSNHKLAKWYIELGKYCMGVYIFQQFILKYLYYQTELPIQVGTTWLPWIALGIALSGSLLLSYTIKQV